MLAAFIAQFYDDKPPPPLLLINHALPEQDADRRGAVAEGRAEGGNRACRSAGKNARSCGTRRPTRARRWSASWPRSAGQAKLLEGVAELFGLPAPPERIEVYDNCHIMGANRMA